MSVNLHKRYQLGDFELDSDKYLLKHDGQSVHLPELPFQVLLYLVENRERYVSRQELLERFWQGSGAYEETLTKCISTIRTRLNDPPNAPHFIETRKKVGYRYIGPFEERLAQAPLLPEHVVEIERLGKVSISVYDDDRIPFNELPTFFEQPIPGPLISAPAQSAWWNKRVAVVTIVLLLGAVTTLWLLRRVQPHEQPIAVGRPERSIAVLPLKNLTGDQSNEYFSDGMTDGLITSLSKIDGLKVCSRSSVFRFKTKELTPQEIGNELEVEAVLEGAVRSVGSSVRVSVRLVSVEDGHVLWASDEVDRSTDDLFALQDNIALNVAAGLKLQLSGSIERQLARRYTDNVEAYQLYLQGRFYANRFSGKDDLLKAVRYFDSAIAKDANYALAYAGLADTYTTMALDWRDPNEVFPKARDYALAALELDDTLGEAHFARGAIAFFYDWDWTAAQTELERALDLDAKSVEGNACYLHSRETLGNTDEAFASIQKALQRNPLSTFISAERGCAAYYAHLYDQAADLSRETVRISPGYMFARYNLARALGQKRMYEQAIAELNATIDTAGRSTMLIAELGYHYAASGRRREAEELLRELRQRSTTEYVDPYPVAWIYVALGDNNKALQSLERAYEGRSAWIPWVNAEPKFEPLHSDPRFKDLLRRLKLPV